MLPKGSSLGKEGAALIQPASSIRPKSNREGDPSATEATPVCGPGRWSASWGPAGESNALGLMVAFRLDGHDSGR
jgi:hypothetical protein